MDKKFEPVCHFSIGQTIHHLLFDYIGVIFDFDVSFQDTEELYLEMARIKPPRGKPWYHVLVNQSASMTYVAERNLKAEPSPHPLINQYFSRLKGGFYLVDVS